MNTKKMVMIKELDQVIRTPVALDDFKAANQLIADLVADAVKNGTATIEDEEGCPVTATVWDA